MVNLTTIEDRTAFHRDYRLVPRTWRPATRDGIKTARIACPDCGVHGTLEPIDHEILPDGQVRPSLVCPGCGYHETIRLINWGGR